MADWDQDEELRDKGKRERGERVLIIYIKGEKRKKIERGYRERV